MRKILTIMCLILLVFPIAAVSAADVNQDISVMQSPDGGTFTELQEKVNNAEEGSTINLENNYTYDDSFEKEYILIDKNIVINGNGYTIDAKETSGIFNISTNNVALNNINFINAYASSGAVFNSFGDLTVSACSFINNIALYDGGAIFNYGNLEMDDCSFINNGAWYDGGAIYSYNNLTVSGCSFVGNRARSGGAIYHNYWDYYGSLAIDDSSFVGNVDGGFGVIYSETADNDYIYNTVFVNNSPSDFYPEDIHTENITLSSHIDFYLPKYLFSRSEQVPIIIYLDDGATGDVILSINGVEETLTLTNSGVSVTKSDLNVGNYDVFVKYMGDNAFTPSEKSTAFEVVEESTFSVLQQLIDDAEVGSTINLENDYVSDNKQIKINKSLTINGNGYTLDARGYAILDIESDNVTLKNITFINGGGYESPLSVYGNNTIISDCCFKDNQNSAGSNSEGGALFISGRNTIISGCYFENNGFEGLVDLYGGAIGICGNDTLISDCYFEDNYVSGEYSSGGGAIFCDGDLTVVNSAFISNTVSCYGSLGGAIYSKGNLSISDSFFTDNTLYGVNVYGGAIYAESVYVNNSAFESNNIHAFKSWETGSSARGGAISSQAAYIFNSNFTNNSASSDDEYNPSSGGAVCSSGILNVERSNFENNTADKGEALWAYLAYSNIDDCNFTNNDYVLVKAYIVAWDLNKLYGRSEQLRIYLTEDDKVLANARVTININGINYFRTTNEEGIALMDINLNPGEYNATVTYEDACAISKITIVSTVDGENITKIFRNATQYRATFWDSEGYRLNNTQVEFNINGILYKRFTDKEGVAKLNINLNPGEYIITAKNTNSGELYSNVITVLPNMDENHDLIKYYRNDSQYVVRLLDDEGNPVGAGVNVTFNINGVFYNRTTNATGHAKLNINLQPGTYIITAIYKDLAMANTITVLPVLEAENLEMKYHDGSQFNVTLLDGQGKPYAGQNVTFNVNGVFYVRNTDVNGVAHLNINLMAGEYIITSSYNNSNIANKITISS